MNPHSLVEAFFFCQSVPHGSYMMHADSKGSDHTAQIWGLVWAFAKYPFHLFWLFLYHAQGQRDGSYLIIDFIIHHPCSNTIQSLNKYVIASSGLVMFALQACLSIKSLCMSLANTDDILGHWTGDASEDVRLKLISKLCDGINHCCAPIIAQIMHYTSKGN